MSSRQWVALVLFAACLLALPANASAEPTRHIQFDTTFGARFGDSNVFGVRGFIGYYQSLAAFNPTTALYFAIGPHIEVGWVSIPPEEEDNNNDEEETPTPTFGRWGVGIAGRLGFAFGDGKAPDYYVWAGGAPVYSDVGEDGAFGTPETEGVWGAHFNIGFAWRGSWQLAEDMDEESSCDGGTCAIGTILLLLLPNTLEATMDGFGSETTMPLRFGFGFGWSI